MSAGNGVIIKYALYCEPTYKTYYCLVIGFNIRNKKVTIAWWHENNANEYEVPPFDFLPKIKH